MQRLDVDRDEIVRLYVEEELKGRAIAQRLGCSDAVVYQRLQEAGVSRPRKKSLPKDEVMSLYRAGWSIGRIGDRFGVANGTVAARLREWGVRIRGQVEARQPTNRRPCPPAVTFRAYLLGLVWGDFVVRTHGPTGLTLTVATNTTRPEQVALAQLVFSPFGPVRHGGRTVRASLDLSFAFLFSKYDLVVPAWIKGPEAEAAFAAGYVDAEGSFGVYEGRARFKLDSYHSDVLAWFDWWAGKNGISVRRRLVSRTGCLQSDGTTLNGDLWRVNVNEAFSMLRLIASLEPYVRHARRRADMHRAQNSVVERLRARDPATTHP